MECTRRSIRPLRCPRGHRLMGLWGIPTALWAALVIEILLVRTTAR